MNVAPSCSHSFFLMSFDWNLKSTWDTSDFVTEALDYATEATYELVSIFVFCFCSFCNLFK